MANKTLDQAVQGVLEAPIIRQIILDLKPDLAKLREAIATALKGVAKAREEELVKGWEAAKQSGKGETVCRWGKGRARSQEDERVDAEIDRFFNELEVKYNKAHALKEMLNNDDLLGFQNVLEFARRLKVQLPRL